MDNKIDLIDENTTLSKEVFWFNDLALDVCNIPREPAYKYGAFFLIRDDKICSYQVRKLDCKKLMSVMATKVEELVWENEKRKINVLLVVDWDDDDKNNNDDTKKCFRAFCEDGETMLVEFTTESFVGMLFELSELQVIMRKNW